MHSEFIIADDVRSDVFEMIEWYILISRKTLEDVF
jgi:hypothetical protein